MAVGFDSTFAKNTGGGVTTLDLVATVGTGSNRALIFVAAWEPSTVSAITPIWDFAGTNQTMSLITSTTINAGQGISAIYGLVAPTSGSNTLRTSWTTSAAVGLTAVAFTGVDQTGGATSFIAATPASGTSIHPAITITSTSGNATVDVIEAVSNNPNTPTQTIIDSVFGGLLVGGAGASYALATGNMTHSWTIASQLWSAIGVNIVAAGAAAPVQGSGYNSRSTIVLDQPRRLGGLASPAPRVRTGRR